MARAATPASGLAPFIAGKGFDFPQAMYIDGAPFSETPLHDDLPFDCTPTRPQSQAGYVSTNPLDAHEPGAPSAPRWAAGSARHHDRRLSGRGVRWHRHDPGSRPRPRGTPARNDGRGRHGVAKDRPEP